MAVLSPEEYKAAYEKVSKQYSDLSAEHDRSRKELKRIDLAEAAAAEAAEKQAEAEALLASVSAQLAQARSALEASQANAARLQGKADRYDAIKAALA